MAHDDVRKLRLLYARGSPYGATGLMFVFGFRAKPTEDFTK